MKNNDNKDKKERYFPIWGPEATEGGVLGIQRRRGRSLQWVRVAFIHLFTCSLNKPLLGTYSILSPVSWPAPSMKK